jgi:hypothetical protein
MAGPMFVSATSRMPTGGGNEAVVTVQAAGDPSADGGSGVKGIEDGE